MAIPQTDQLENLLSGIGTETFPDSIILNNSMWTVYSAFGNLNLIEYQGSRFTRIRRNVINFRLSRALNNDLTLNPNCFWLWEITPSNILNLVEIQPHSNAQPDIVSATSLKTGVLQVKAVVNPEKNVNVFCINNTIPNTIKARKYVTAARVVGDPTPVSIFIPNVAAYTYHIPEMTDPDFRELDTLDFVTEIYQGVTRYTQFVLPTATSFAPDYTTGQVNVGVNIAVGTPVMITTNGILPRFLQDQAVYYAINVDSSHIKLALTYADALSNTPIAFVDNGNGTHTFQQVAPTTGTYYSGANGIFVFSATDAGNAITLVYTYTLFN